MAKFPKIRNPGKIKNAIDDIIATFSSNNLFVIKLVKIIHVGPMIEMKIFTRVKLSKEAIGANKIS